MHSLTAINAESFGTKRNLSHGSVGIRWTPAVELIAFADVTSWMCHDTRRSTFGSSLNSWSSTVLAGHQKAEKYCHLYYESCNTCPIRMLVLKSLDAPSTILNCSRSTNAGKKDIIRCSIHTVFIDPYGIRDLGWNCYSQQFILIDLWLIGFIEEGSNVTIRYCLKELRYCAQLSHYREWRKGFCQEDHSLLSA
ncbi:hypothetical protein Tco_0409219 [Tanacetum coccineum]